MSQNVWWGVINIGPRQQSTLYHRPHRGSSISSALWRLLRCQRYSWRCKDATPFRRLLACHHPDPDGTACSYPMTWCSVETVQRVNAWQGVPPYEADDSLCFVHCCLRLDSRQMFWLWWHRPDTDGTSSDVFVPHDLVICRISVPFQRMARTP